jgi:hypothetical protein
LFGNIEQSLQNAAKRQREKTMKVLVIGATGRVGNEVV